MRLPFTTGVTPRTLLDRVVQTHYVTWLALHDNGCCGHSGQGLKHRKAVRTELRSHRVQNVPAKEASIPVR